MSYLEKCYLIFIGYLELCIKFPIYINLSIINYQLNSIVARGYVLIDLHHVKFTETCAMVQDMIYLGNCVMCTC